MHRCQNNYGVTSSALRSKDSNGLKDGEAEGDPGSDSRRVRRGISVVPESR